MEVLKDPYVLTGSSLVGGVLVISVLTRLLSSNAPTYANGYVQRVVAIVQQAQDANKMASQDTDPVMALQHITQCMVYMDVALRMMDANTLAQHVDIDVHTFVERARKKQSQAQRLVGPRQNSENISGVRVGN